MTGDMQQSIMASSRGGGTKGQGAAGPWNWRGHDDKGVVIGGGGDSWSEGSGSEVQQSTA